METRDFMNNDRSSSTGRILKGNWNELKGKLKQQYSKLTDDDLMYQEGREDELIGRLQKSLGKTENEIRDILDSLSHSETIGSGSYKENTMF
jgi:uncharacterized protein YjbJ (UPF0337 family)